MRIAQRLVAALVAVIALCCIPATARADAEDLRDRAHARLAVVMDQALEDGVYSQPQRDYVLSALRPSYVDPIQLSFRTESKTLDSFWAIVVDGTDLTEEQVQMRVSKGATLNRITGDKAEDVRALLWKWLARPAFQSFIEEEISATEFADLREDISRAVWRVMAQPGGDRDVVLVPRRAPVDLASPAGGLL